MQQSSPAELLEKAFANVAMVRTNRQYNNTAFTFADMRHLILEAKALETKEADAEQKSHERALNDAAGPAGQDL